MSVPHQLSQEEALGRIKNLITRLKDEQKDIVKNVQEEWQNDTGKFQFTAQGFDLSGSIRVQEGSVDIDAKIPLAVSFFSGKIKELISKKATELLQ